MVADAACKAWLAGSSLSLSLPPVFLALPLSPVHTYIDTFARSAGARTRTYACCLSLSLPRAYVETLSFHVRASRRDPRATRSPIRSPSARRVLPSSRIAPCRFTGVSSLANLPAVPRITVSRGGISGNRRHSWCGPSARPRATWTDSRPRERRLVFQTTLHAYSCLACRA